MFQHIERLMAEARFSLNLLSVSRVAVQYSAASCVHSLNDQMVQNHLLLCSLDDILLHRSLGDQPINIHLRPEIYVRLRCGEIPQPDPGGWGGELLPLADLLLLANPVSPGLSLQVVLRVPVRVKDDHGVCRGQVDA